MSSCCDGTCEVRSVRRQIHRNFHLNSDECCVGVGVGVRVFNSRNISLFGLSLLAQLKDNSGGITAAAAAVSITDKINKYQVNEYH